MSGWEMLLVGLLLFALAVLLIWLWQQFESKEQPRPLPTRQPPKIVIRPRRFTVKRIVEQSAALPPATPRPMPRAATAQRTTPEPATAPRTVTLPTTVTRTTPSPATVLRTMPQTATPPRIVTTPTTTPLRPSPSMPPPPPAATVNRLVEQPSRGPVIVDGSIKFKVDFDAFCKRTGRVVRDCQCRECRKLKTDAGI